MASCKSLPSTPSHSAASTPVGGIHPGQVPPGSPCLGRVLPPNTSTCPSGYGTPGLTPRPIQASNGGHTSDYSSSLPSTPNVSHRELRSETPAPLGTPSSLHRGAKRRTSLFAVSVPGPPWWQPRGTHGVPLAGWWQGEGGSWHPGCHPPGWWQHGARGIWGVYSAAGGTQYVGCPSGMVVVEAQGDTWHLGCPPWQGADGGHTRHPGCLHYGGLAVGEGGHPRVSPQQSRSGGGRGTPSAPTTRPTDPVLRLPADAPGQRLGEAEPGQPGRGGGQRPCHPHQAGRRGGGGGGGTRQGPQPSPPCPPHRPFVPRASC